LSPFAEKNKNKKCAIYILHSEEQDVM